MIAHAAQVLKGRRELQPTSRSFYRRWSPRGFQAMALAEDTLITIGTTYVIYSTAVTRDYKNLDRQIRVRIDKKSTEIRAGQAGR
jgi:hypothetical protein